MHLTFKQTHSQRRSSVGIYYAPVYEGELDEHIFFSVPTSFFVIDERIPRIIRELITEAEGCVKMNFLTGAY